MRTRALLAALALVVLAGCGSEAGITRGGTIIGDTLTVYSMLPQPSAGVSRDILDGEKLALAEAGGRAGGFGINFVSLDEGAEDPAETVSRAASASRDAISDPQIIAVIDALDSATAMTTVPLFNAAGILQVSPGAGYPGLTSPAAPGEPERYQPAGVPTFARVVGDDRDQAAALVAAAIAEAGPRPSVAIQAEPGPEAAALAAAVRVRLRARGARVVASPAQADAVVYAGSDAGKAAQAAGAGAGGAFILPDAVVRTGVAARLVAGRPAAGGARLPRAATGLDAGAAPLRGHVRRAPGPPAGAVRRARLRGDAQRAVGGRARGRRRQPPQRGHRRLLPRAGSRLAARALAHPARRPADESRLQRRAGARRRAGREPRCRAAATGLTGRRHPSRPTRS